MNNRNRELSCSVIIPCYNEADNIAECLKRIPKMGRFTEVIVVDDGSTDDTRARVNPDINRNIEIKLLSYKPNRGKGYAVRTGFSNAKGEVLMILDADMTVSPEELPKFFKIFENGFEGFVNGTRFLIPMERNAMPLKNYIGNKLFTLIINIIIGQRVSDTLCGTKALFRKDFEKFAMRDNFWGDFDLLFGAAKLRLKIHEVPVQYKARVAGRSKMKAFKHGLVLLGVCWQAFKELRLAK